MENSHVINEVTEEVVNEGSSQYPDNEYTYMTNAEEEDSGEETSEDRYSVSNLSH